MTADIDVAPDGEARLRAALDAAATTNPVPPAWDVIRERVEADERPGPTRRRSAPLLVAAAVLAALAVVGVATTGGDDEGVVADGRSESEEAYCAVLERGARARLAVIVFLEVAEPRDLDDVEAAIAATGVAGDVAYVDQATSFAEAQALFADDPTFHDLLRPEDVPTSFRLTVADAAAADALAAAVEPTPGVLSIEDGRAWRPDVLQVLDEIALADGSVALTHPTWLDDDVRAALVGSAPEEVAAEVAELDPLLRSDSAPTTAQGDAASALVLDAAERCGLRPEPLGRPPVLLDGGQPVTTTEPR